jgi:hypothetical protein
MNSHSSYNFYESLFADVPSYLYPDSTGQDLFDQPTVDPQLLDLYSEGHMPADLNAFDDSVLIDAP